MKYRSTRGGVSGISFTDALLMGLADDGGLLIPDHIPDVSSRLQDWRNLNFVQVAQRLLKLFIDDLEHDDLDALTSEAFSSFDIPEVVAWRQLDQLHVLELFHGPTLAFKDVALQLLGKLFEHVLADRGERLNILGATSGDTGSAAIAGVAGMENIKIFILYPEGRISSLQELQMTTVPDANVQCISVSGTFDDCQRIMKSIFSDLDFKESYSLGAINSVNWARVLAQVIYYAYASLQKENTSVDFVVPTGNFGNIFAGFIAKKMGFPVGRLLVATNENDILDRFFKTGEYSLGEVFRTNSPAMDIQVASNFERFLFYYFDEDADRLRGFMEEFARSGKASVVGPLSSDIFLSCSISQPDTEETIAEINSKYGYVIDPHTAVGIRAARTIVTDDPIVCIATAHPAKFPDALGRAIGYRPSHSRLSGLSDLQERKQQVLADESEVKKIIQNFSASI